MGRLAKKIILFGGGKQPVKFLLRALFNTPISSPVPSPYECEEGSLVLTQTGGGSFSVANGRLEVTAQTSPSYTGLGYYSSPPLARSPGLLFATMTYGQPSTGKYCSVGSGPGNSFEYYMRHGVNGLGLSASFCFGDSTVKSFDQSVYGGTNGTGTKIFSTILFPGAGFIKFFDYYAHIISRNDTSTGLVAKYCSFDAENDHDYVVAAQLPSPFDSDSFRSMDVTYPTIGAEYDYVDMDVMLLLDWTAQAGEILEWKFRIFDATNFISLRWNQSTGLMQIVETYAGVETIKQSVSVACAVGAHTIELKAINNYINVWVDGYYYMGVLDWFFLDKTRTSVSGSAGVSRLVAYPGELSGSDLDTFDLRVNPFKNGDRTPQIIDVPDGEDIQTAISSMRRGDILRLAEGGSYTTQITNLPDGFHDYPTTVLGRGATISGGVNGVRVQNAHHIKIDGVICEQATNTAITLQQSRHVEISNSYFHTSVTGSYGVLYIDACVDVVISDCICDGTGAMLGSFDGFELYGNCRNITIRDCEARNVRGNGYEIWTYAWYNRDVLIENCWAHHCQNAGFSSEGGVTLLDHPNCLVVNPRVNNNFYDFEGIESATLRVSNPPATYTITGSVVIV